MHARELVMGRGGSPLVQIIFIDPEPHNIKNWDAEAEERDARDANHKYEQAVEAVVAMHREVSLPVVTHNLWREVESICFEVESNCIVDGEGGALLASSCFGSPAMKSMSRKKT